MSRLRAQGAELRAIVVIAAALALVSNLVFSGLAHANSALHASVSGGAHLVVCHDHDHGLAGLDQASHSGNGQSGRIHCPDCCLAAHAGSAVLPERCFTAMRPDRTAAPVFYYAFSERQPRFAAPDAGNGARAPPAYALAA